MDPPGRGRGLLFFMAKQRLSKLQRWILKNTLANGNEDAEGVMLLRKHFIELWRREHKLMHATATYIPRFDHQNSREWNKEINDKEESTSRLFASSMCR